MTSKSHQVSKSFERSGASTKRSIGESEVSRTPKLDRAPHRRHVFGGNHILLRGQALQRKCGCGGRCDECRRGAKKLQPALAVSDVGDRYEQEADRVATQVLASKGASIKGSHLQIQRYSGAAQEPSISTPKSVESVLSAKGVPLNPNVREDMEQRFGYDFSSVRLHLGSTAKASATELNAQAYTVGHDIVFGPGQYAPETFQGRRLIAHELTHVIQQTGPTSEGFGSVQRKVVDDDEHLPCRGSEGKSASVVASRENEAADFAERAAAALRTHPISETARELLWRRFRLDYNDPIDRCRFMPEIADRFETIASNIRNTETTYGCASAGEPSSYCNGHFAFTYPGLLGGKKIDLCARFWSNPKEQAATLLHEWAHYVFEPRGLKDEPFGGFDTAECYANFALKLAGKDVTEFEDASKCVENEKPLPKLDSARLRLPCPGNVFLNISALGGLAAGIPGTSRGFAGVGLDYTFPLTRMHDWELSLGGRFMRFAPADSKDRTAYLFGVRAGLAFRYQPWRFGRQLGGFLEGGRISVPTEAGEQTHTYGAVGLSGGINLRIDRQKALQILGEVKGAYGFASQDEPSFKWVQLGLSVVFTFE